METNLDLQLRKREAHDEGFELGKKLTDALNSMTYEKDLTEGFVEGILRSHPTLQQSTMRALYQVILGWAERCEHIQADLDGRIFDGRNEATLKFCKRIKDMVETENIHFPFI